MSSELDDHGRFEEALAAFKRGEMLVVLDHHRRENEGDIVVAAEKCGPDQINFMATHGRGLICVAMEIEMIDRLGLSSAACFGRRTQFNTAFTESVDASAGITTGISAHDRARTVAALVDPASTPASLVRPGHIFPLAAVENGVFRRPGHTEAAVDLARLAGLRGAGVICEIMRDDGDMARGQDLADFAAKHGLHMITIEQIAGHRKLKERLIRKDRSVALPTPFGLFELHLYHSIVDGKEHLAMVMGDPAGEEMPLVRVHSECLTGDVLGSMRCDCGPQLHEAMRRVGERGAGAVLYMRQEGRGIGLRHKLSAYALQDEGYDTVDANTKLGFDPDMRDYCTAAQILQDLKIDNIELMTNNPLKISSLEKYGVSIARRMPIIIDPNDFNKFYLETKERRLGHIFADE
jgi:3,4-dihydroxy 2-butanone 4-phosphate synthase / GTP cyclohydrolase II